MSAANGRSISLACGVATAALLVSLAFPLPRYDHGPSVEWQGAAPGSPGRSIAAARSTPSMYDESGDLSGFVERAAARLDDPATMYYVSQALEECRTSSATFGEGDAATIPPSGALPWIRLAAGEALAAPCRGFAGRSIDPREILALLQEAARQGEPRARARMLLFRDIAAAKSDVIAEIPGLLATGDPAVVRDVGAFLAKGETSLRFGDATVDASTAAIAWELVACDLGYPCGPASRLVLSQCAFSGHCDASRYDEAIARGEDPERMAQARQLREGLLHALQRGDWIWLGLRENAAPVL